MRRKLCAALAGFLLAISTATAAPVWTAPAWYVVADTIVGPFVWSGPYGDEAACGTQLPANEPDADYFCEYLAERPSWDE